MAIHLPVILTHALAAILPKVLEDGYEYVCGCFKDDDPIVTVDKPKSNRKKMDSTKITVNQFDIIQVERQKMIEHNDSHPRRVDKMTEADLTKILNNILFLNKSTYKNYYNGTYTRSQCIQG